jgi:membrane complex biogenesis BtpA family protein
MFPPRALIGMVHVDALPGSPMHRAGIREIIARAADEARVLVETGFDAIIIENMHDRPYVHGRKGPETTACMTAIALEIRRVARRDGEDLPLGVQVLSGGNHEALAIAHAAGAQFIRCENFVFSHIADEGLLATAEAGALLRYRRSIGAEHVRILCDIKKKHASHAITADLSISDVAEGADFFLADGLIVTGAATGKPADIDDIRAVRKATKLPVLVGSGVTPALVRQQLAHCDGLIVGSYIKRDGVWNHELDAARCREIVAARAG